MKMQRKTNWTLGCLVGLGLLGACNVELTEFESDGELRKTGMALTSDTLADTDVARMQYTIEGVDCTTGLPTDPAMTKTVVKDLEDMLIPGGNPDLENSPLDAGSGHLFADAFFWLPEGCYDVSVVPLQEDGSVSVDCSSASEQLVPVYDG
jgi:hypothetical protein